MELMFAQSSSFQVYTFDMSQCGCVRQGYRVVQKAWVWSYGGIDDDSRMVDMAMEGLV